jgi:D-glycero-D-manno-heptose 1,7-bisphosphate phosphatase
MKKKKQIDYEKLWEQFSRRHSHEIIGEVEISIAFAKYVIEKTKKKRKYPKKEEKPKVEKKDTLLQPPYKAIFLDRDGTINKRPKPHHYVRFIADLKTKMFPYTEQHIKILKKAGYKVFLITNQAGISKGIISTLEYNKMLRYLSTLGIDMIYTCPHTDEENCKCRKPKSGMIHQAVHDWKIDLKTSWMVGDTDRDYMAGINAGCKVYQGTLENFIKTIIMHLGD